MYLRKVASISFLFLGFVCSCCATSSPSFEEMMGDFGGFMWKNIEREKLWKIPAVSDSSVKIRAHYHEAINFLEKEPINTVPRTIHFIWIGPKSFPTESVANVLSWVELHPSWDICFWTDDPKRPLPVEGMRRRLVHEFDFDALSPYIEASPNYAAKSDLMRYMILYKEGGVYADHDVECIQPFDSLASHFDFVAGYEPLHRYRLAPENPFLPNNGLIVSCPDHEILEKTIERVCKHWDSATGQGIWKTVVFRTFDPFAYCATTLLDKANGRNIILPTCCFQAFAGFKKETLARLKKEGRVYAIHHFESTWNSSHKTK